jgi:hypothetical protein
VNTEINFGISGRCGVNGQLSNHYNLKDYGLKQFFGEEKKSIPHNVIFSALLMLPAPKFQYFLQH